MVPTDGCLTKDGHTLLYVGISPKNDSSSENLRKRVNYHFRGNAEGSTLRLTLGTLLAPLIPTAAEADSGIPLSGEQ